jgi:predicted Zn-dependent protease
MTRQLVLWLLEQGYQPLHLRPSLQGNQALTAALEEAIALREQGQAALSLALLQQLLSFGQQSPWIHDNIARAMLQLGQPSPAVELWRELQGDSDREVARAAAEMLQQVQQRLLDGLMLHCRFHGWSPRHLPHEIGLSSLNLLELALEEAITSREADQAGLSLALMEEAINQGWDSPWLHDNRARALVNLGQRDAAIEIWTLLISQADVNAVQAAREALDQQQRLIAREAQLARAEQLLRSGDVAQAESLLLQAWLIQPEDARVQQLLAEVIAPQPASCGELLDQELAAVHHRLTVEERLQDHLEQVLG